MRNSQEHIQPTPSRYSLAEWPSAPVFEVLARLGLRQHPDKTLIGRLHDERGFDFLGIQFTGRGERSPSAVSQTRHTEKTARLYEHLSAIALAKEEGASPPTTKVEVKKRIE